MARKSVVAAWRSTKPVRNPHRQHPAAATAVAGIAMVVAAAKDFPTKITVKPLGSRANRVGNCRNYSGSPIVPCLKETKSGHYISKASKRDEETGKSTRESCAPRTKETRKA